MISSQPPSFRRSASSRIGGPLIVAVLLFSFTYAAATYAHGEAEWIMKNPDYTDKFGHQCCGPEDCERIPESFVREEGLDIHILPTRQKFRKGDRGVYQSRDTSWWWCKSKQLPGLNFPMISCIFFPYYGH